MSPPFRPDPVAQAWSERLARLVWCTGVADQLAELGTWLDFSGGPFPPGTPERFASYQLPDKGLSLRLHYPFWDRVVTYDPNQWLIADVTFDPNRAPLPFAMERDTETSQSAEHKLSRDHDDFPATKTVTFYLDDNRAVSIRYQDGHMGIESLRVTRLYGSIPFRKD